MAKAYIKYLNFLAVWFLPLHGPIFLSTRQQQPGSTVGGVAPTSLLQTLEHQERHLACGDMIFFPISPSVWTFCISAVQKDVPADT